MEANNLGGDIHDVRALYADGHHTEIIFLQRCLSGDSHIWTNNDIRQNGTCHKVPYILLMIPQRAVTGPKKLFKINTIPSALNTKFQSLYVHV